MSVTERLRELLDERGVEYKTYDPPYPEFSTPTSDITTKWGNASYREWPNGTIRFSARGTTPEQAIAATLGAGTCLLHDCDGSFSSVSRPVWRCDCGAFMTQYTDATTYHKPRFCPNCGKRVMD